MTETEVQRLFEELKRLPGRDGCKLEDVSTRRDATSIVWSRGNAKLPPVLVAPRGCLVSPDLDGPELQAAVPSAVRRSCPAGYAKLQTLIGRPVGGLAEKRLGSRRSSTLPRSVTAGLFVLSLLLSLLLVALGVRNRKPWETAERKWLLIVAASFAIALLLRLSVEPALANWYSDVLFSPGAPGGRFGFGFIVLQRGLSALLPFSDTTLFAVNATLGAMAVPIVVAIARERRLPLPAVAALAVLFALAPFHVRISASASEHVLSSTLMLAALWLWLRAQRLGSKLHAALALSLMALAVMTRAEAWIQLAAIGLWGIWRDPDEEAPARGTRWRYALVFLLAWLLVGTLDYFLIVLPSRHPGPDFDGILAAASQLVLQYRDVAFESPHWMSPLAVVLAVPGLGYLLLFKRRLLAGIVVFLVFAFVPLGRTLQHDGLIGARYFLATIPVFLMLSACGVYVCGRAILWALRRAPRLAALAHLEEGALAVVLLAVGFADLALVAPAYRARYTFQDEYTFLRGALARVPDGCTIVSLPVRYHLFGRDMDCCLDITHSPLSLAYPRLGFKTVERAGDLAGPGCRYYYESAACSIAGPRSKLKAPDRSTFDFFQRACGQMERRSRPPVANTRVSSRSTNGFFDQRAPEVRLFPVAPSGRK